MKLKNCIPLSILLAFVTLPALNKASAGPVIEVALRFHIVTDLTMDKDGLLMQSWVTQKDIENTILPEVNRIWQPAGITFKTDAVFQSQALSPPDKAALVKMIVNAQRDSSGKADRNRIKKLNQLIDWRQHDARAINIYYVPFLGETSQGNARRKDKRIFVGQWTDKPSGGEHAPERFQLTESLPFKYGSISRTTAHEIGHILGLKHPDKSVQTVFGLLMGGKKAGYKLTLAEIQTARDHALESR